MKLARATVVAAAFITVLAAGVYAYDRWLSDDDSAEARPLVTAPSRATVLLDLPFPIDAINSY
jgi:hypothetical protein